MAVFLRIDGNQAGNAPDFEVSIAVDAVHKPFSSESRQSRKKAVVFFFFFSLKMAVGGRRSSGSFAHLDIRTWLLVCLLLPSPTGWAKCNFQEDLVL